MPRARTGTLVPPGADGFWRARASRKEHADGTKTRLLYSLGTTDKAIARRKLARLNALILAGHDPHDAAIEVGTPERVKDYADAWLSKRKAQGVGMARKERRALELYALDAIGRLPLCDVRPSHVRGILDDAAAKGLRRATVSEIRGALHRLFRDALEGELVEHNPVTPVRTPKTRETRKERAILTDEVFARFVACPEVGLETRMLSLVARCEGGMRTGDLHKWDWSMIDRVHFAECLIPRAKTRTPQRLSIPDVLAPFVRAWWERAGKPVEGTKLAPNPRDPLYFETASTLPVDFHSFRRAFSSALAEAGVNVQHSMHLASHSDPRVHARYVMHTAAMRAIPDAALPVLAIAALTESPEGARIVTDRDVSPPIDADLFGAELPNRSTLRRIVGSDCRTRTCDPAVNSRLLYQLS